MFVLMILQLFCIIMWYGFFRYCGIKNPSWSELHNFVKFLNTQLEDCEGSIYCNEAVVGDVLQGFKQFVVQFMIRMSRVRNTIIYPVQI